MVKLKVTESDSLYNNIEAMTTDEIIANINNEDMKVAYAVRNALPQISKLINAAYKKIKKGGRLVYIGSGTSGRLGILDASECPPTFGVNRENVIGVIAGGNTAVFEAVENAEDNLEKGWEDLLNLQINDRDFVVGISSSGDTPYVVGAIQNCNLHRIKTGAITSNPRSFLKKEAKYPVEVVVGPEFITGSTRMKAGTAQKMVLNMISTTIMIKMGRVKGNKMVDMQLKNRKLIERGTRIIASELKIDHQIAMDYLLKYKSVRKVLKKFRN